jgi:hypothetical protein
MGMRIESRHAHMGAGGSRMGADRGAPTLLRGGTTAALLLAAATAAPDDAMAGGCTLTAQAAFRACRAELVDDFWINFGTCATQSDPADRNECSTEGRDERDETRELCRDQLAARRDLCQALDEDRYDPDFDPANFVDPLQIGGAVEPNHYFPLMPGTRWVYEGEGETVAVTVLNETKLIEGVTCIVVNDLVEDEAGVPIEDTDDWYAQDTAGNIWYCGEISMNFELFPGDDPPDAELVDVDGSWKAGRDGARPGIIMLASPQVGDVYRQEFALGEGEDAAEVVSTTSSEMAPAASCSGDCVVTRDFTPLEPDVEENKFYAPGVGLILEVDMETGDRVELVEFTIVP